MLAQRAQDVRDSPKRTAFVLLGVLGAHLPLVLMFSGTPVPVLGVFAAWLLAALGWTAYAGVHMLAPVADLRNHPNRSEWGPIERINLYTHASLKQLGIRICFGIWGFLLGGTGAVLFATSGWMRVFPGAVVILAVLLMSAHVGIKEPDEETKEHL